jgi:hypothetical protein
MSEICPLFFIADTVYQGGMGQLPTETWINIFSLVCEIEFQITPYNRYVMNDEARYGTQPRSLKEFMIPVVQVCKLWRDIVYSGAFFWVTRLRLNVTEFEEDVKQEILVLQQCLLSSVGSDIDFSLSVFPNSLVVPTTFAPAMACFETDILPVRERIRCLWFYQSVHKNGADLLLSFLNLLQDDSVQ